MTKGTLFVVATPIGNRADVSLRAQQTLQKAQLIAAEDTRHTGRLLSDFGINTPLKALHEHNEAEVVDDLIERLIGGESVALVSDAGTPLISDPGYRLIVAAHRAQVDVSPIPGPSAITAALSVAGLPTDRFCFEGFLPAKRAARRARLAALRGEVRSLVFFASVHKIRATLVDLIEAFGEQRSAFIGRELTKLHEQCLKASLADLAQGLEDGRIAAKGEFVLVVSGAPAQSDDDGDAALKAWLTELSEALPGRQAVDLVARVSGRRRNDVYRLFLSLEDH